MLASGDPAPDFDLSGTTGDETGTFRLSAAAREGPVVLAFCGDGGQLDRDLLGALADADWAAVADRLAVMAVAPDEASRDRLVEEASPPFPVLADRDGFVADLYGLAPGTRAAFLVDRRCTVLAARSIGDPPGGDVAALRDALARR